MKYLILLPVLIATIVFMVACKDKEKAMNELLDGIKIAQSSIAFIPISTDDKVIINDGLRAVEDSIILYQQGTGSIKSVVAEWTKFNDEVGKIPNLPPQFRAVLTTISLALDNIAN